MTELSNDRDHFSEFLPKQTPPQHFTPLNQQVLRDAVLSTSAEAIMEIGVHRPRSGSQHSSTLVILEAMSDEAVYCGVDIAERKLPARKPNSFFLRHDSSDWSAVIDFLASHNVLALDVLMIDGDHSVNQVLRDWRYASLVRPGGKVVMHDTNYHPGPVLLFDAIDDSIFEKARHGQGKNDYGISVFCRRT